MDLCNVLTMDSRVLCMLAVPIGTWTGCGLSLGKFVIIASSKRGR
jgi:hypothetical protein